MNQSNKNEGGVKVPFSIHRENDLESYRMDSLFTKEPETIFWIEDFICPGEVFFDIGANIGLYSLFAHSKSGAIAYCFEPFLKNYVRLVQNIKLNDFKQIHAFPIALSNEYQINRFYSFDTRTGASGGQICEPVSEDKTPFEAIDEQDVIIMPLDCMVSDYKLPGPNHVKIDVDGNEMKILQGMTNILDSSELRSLLIEVNPLVSDMGLLLQFMSSRGFHTENKYNAMESHSRYRRKSKGEGAPENIIFIRE